MLSICGLEKGSWTGASKVKKYWSVFAGWCELDVACLKLEVVAPLCVSILSGCRRDKVKHCVVQLVGLPTSGRAVTFGSWTQWMFKSRVVYSRN